MDDNTGIRYVGKREKPSALKDPIKVDDSNVYFSGKAMSIERWRNQSIQVGLPPDMYLDIAAKVENERGFHSVTHLGEKFLVGIAGVVESRYGQHTEVVSIARYD